MERGKETLERAMEAWKRGIRPSIPEALQVVMGMAGRIGKLNAQILAEGVKREPVLVERLLRMAHSAGFNPMGSPIYSLTQAIAVVGFDAVRSQSRNLITMERGKSGRIGTEIRKYAGLRNVVSSWVAQELAFMSKAASPEVAYLATSLRGYGRLVLATIAPVEFHAALALEAEKNESEAFMEVFGLKPWEVSRHLLQHGRLGSLLVRSLEDCPEEILGQEVTVPELRVLILSFLAERTAFWMMRGDCEEERFRREMEVLAPKANGIVPDFLGKLERVLLKVDENLRLMARECERGAVPLNLLDCIQSRIERKDPKESIIPRIEEVEEEWKLELPPMETEEDWRLAEEELKRLLRRGGDGVWEARRYLLRCLKEGYRADECWFFLPEGSEMVLIDGVGTQVEGMKMHARFRLGSGGLFDLCYRRGENVFLKDLRDQNFLRHLPIWFREGVELGGFLLVTKKLTEGYGLLIMMGWKEGAFLIQSKEIHGIIDRMVNLYLQNQYGCEGE